MTDNMKDLISKVREIDRDAADYLVKEVSKLKNFGGGLSSVMLWQNTPQGHDYWAAIDNKLHEIAIKSGECDCIPDALSRKYTQGI
jgi:hypothetical protein